MPRRTVVVCTLLVAGPVACDKVSVDRGDSRIAVADAPKHEREARLTLEGGRLLLDRGGAYERPCPPGAPSPPRNAPRCTDHYFYVFPLVPEEWSPAAPVPAWITCVGRPQSLDACREAAAAHQGAHSGTVAVRVGDRERSGRLESGWEKAIDAAAAAHGLAAAPRGPVIRLGDR
jgi:hypothetical protein